MQSRKLDGNAGALINAPTSRCTTNGVDRGLVILVIALGVSSSRRGFTQHVVGIAETAFFQRLGAFQRLVDGFAGDELFAHHAHGHVNATANDRLAATRDQARQSG